jgi:hypothetical protein
MDDRGKPIEISFSLFLIFAQRSESQPTKKSNFLSRLINFDDAIPRRYEQIPN